MCEVLYSIKENKSNNCSLQNVEILAIMPYDKVISMVTWQLWNQFSVFYPKARKVLPKFVLTSKGFSATILSILSDSMN